MIWHILEVWALLAVAFVVGCMLGALLYGLIADSQLALVQGAVADRVGDLVDRIKGGLGLGPAWRPHHLKAVDRPLPLTEEEEEEPPEEEPDQTEENYDYDESEEAYEPEPPPVREQPRMAEREVRRQEPRPIEREVARAAPREARRLPPSERAPLRVPSDEPAYGGGDPDRMASAMTIGADGIVPMRPAGLSWPRGGVPDNLTRIRGIGERNESLLNSLGIFHFGQIAAWTPGEMRWIGQYLAFPERIERDEWVAQAMVLATGGETGFEKSAERRRRRRHERKDISAARQVAAGVARVIDAASALPSDDDEDGEEALRDDEEERDHD